MYEEGSIAKQPTTQAEHLSIAQQFSNEMINRFNAEEVNEILHHIKQFFKERREMEISEAQKKLAYLQNTLDAL
jgi:thermostable 8-oxoguanine DNA glycosylase